MKTIFNHIFIRNFFLKLIGFLSILVLLDYGIGLILKSIYFKQKSGFDYLTTYAIEKAEADILLFGSSRAVNNLNVISFEKELGLTCYNMGRYGEPIFYHHALLQTTLKRFIPKIIVLSFDAGNFKIQQEMYDRLSVLLPYYSTHPELKPTIALKGPFEDLKMVSKIYPFNSLILPIITGHTTYSKNKYANYKGFIPLKSIFNGPLNSVNYTKDTLLDSIKINSYKAFIEDCIKLKIDLYIVTAPYKLNVLGTDRSIIEAKHIAEAYHINFFDFTRDSLFLNGKDLFADSRHLNETGAGIYTNKIIAHIKGVRPSLNNSISMVP